MCKPRLGACAAPQSRQGPKRPFDLLLTRYALERFLYRLGSTKHRQNFALKGAMLITTWFDDPHRPTAI
jgi:hypothetical protein